MKLIIKGLSDYKYLSKENEYNQFGGNGENLSPQLSWNNLPEGTKSLAITLYDPDAPTGSGFWHWVAFDIKPETNFLVKNAGCGENNPNISNAISDFGDKGYGGCCPPEGDIPHRYIFTLHALDCDELGVNTDMPNAVIRFMINMHTIQKDSVVTLYKR